MKNLDWHQASSLAMEQRFAIRRDGWRHWLLYRFYVWILSTTDGSGKEVRRVVKAEDFRDSEFMAKDWTEEPWPGGTTPPCTTLPPAVRITESGVGAWTLDPMRCAGAGEGGNVPPEVLIPPDPPEEPEPDPDVDPNPYAAWRGDWERARPWPPEKDNHALLWYTSFAFFVDEDTEEITAADPAQPYQVLQQQQFPMLYPWYWKPQEIAAANWGDSTGFGGHTCWATDPRGREAVVKLFVNLRCTNDPASPHWNLPWRAYVWYYEANTPADLPVGLKREIHPPPYLKPEPWGSAGNDNVSEIPGTEFFMMRAWGPNSNSAWPPFKNDPGGEPIFDPASFVRGGAHSPEEYANPRNWAGPEGSPGCYGMAIRFGRKIKTQVWPGKEVGCRIDVYTNAGRAATHYVSMRFPPWCNPAFVPGPWPPEEEE